MSLLVHWDPLHCGLTGSWVALILEHKWDHLPGSFVLEFFDLTQLLSLGLDLLVHWDKLCADLTSSWVGNILEHKWDHLPGFLVSEFRDVAQLGLLGWLLRSISSLGISFNRGVRHLKNSFWLFWV